MRLWRFVALAVFLVPTVLHAEAPGVYALTGGTVHPVSGPAIPKGTVVIRNGLIESAGAGSTVPADATVIDVSGAHVYPGLIDAQTSFGFAAAPPVRAGGPGRPSAERPPEPMPDFLAIRNLKLVEDEAEARRATGVTTVVTAPSHGIFNGQSAVLNLGTGSVESRVIKSPAALQISFNPRPTWTYPDSLMGVVSYLRQTFFDAQQHAAATEVYTRSPAGHERPQENPSLEALRPVLRRELPVVFIADTDAAMRRALNIARELNLRPILSGAREAHEMPAELKGVPLLVSVKWPVAPSTAEDREEQPLRVIRARQLAPATPAALAKNAIPFALVSGAGKAGDFIPGIRKAIEQGLSAEEALRAVTQTPARIFGVDRQLGTLERGKIANVVVSDKPLFEKDAKVTRVFVDGREIRLPRPGKSEESAGSSSAPGSVIDGSWAVSIRAPEANVAMQMTLRAEGGQVSGTFSGDRGSGEIRGGSLEGNTFELTLSANLGSDTEASDWHFRGTLSGDTMSGTVTTTLGSFEFSGSRSK